jgi:hypothetical protein
MLRFSMAGLMAAALIALLTEGARAGSVHLDVTKPEVQAARVRLYEHEVDLRDKDPEAFDHKYPVLGKVLASEQGYDEFLSKHTFDRLLCKHTPFLWRVIDGDILYHRIHPFLITPKDPVCPPDPHTYIPPPGGGSAGHGGDPGGSGGLIHPDAVPEPSSWMLMAAGAIFALLAATRRRIYLRLKHLGMPGCLGNR